MEEVAGVAYAEVEGQLQEVGYAETSPAGKWSLSRFPLEMEWSLFGYWVSRV